MINALRDSGGLLADAIISDAMWGPLGLLAGAIVTAVALVVSERIKKRVQPAAPSDIAVTTGQVWKSLNAELKSDLEACRADVKRINDHAKTRDLSTWDYLEAHNDYDDTTDRLVHMLEQVAMRIMNEDERAIYARESELWHTQRATVNTTSKQLRDTLFR